MSDRRRAQRTVLSAAPPAWKRYWLLAAIVLLGAMLRFHDLGAMPPGLCYDEAANAMNAMEATETGRWQVFYPGNFGREGLFINMQGVFFLSAQMLSGGSVTGVEPWLMRAPSAVFGTLTVLGLYLLARVLTGGGPAAAAAALMLATSFWHVNFPRIGFRAITAPFWLVWSLYLLFKGLGWYRDGRRRPGLLLLAAGGLCCGLGFHSYIAYWVAPALLAAVLAWWFLEFRRGARVRDWAVGTTLFVGSAALAAAPLVAYFPTHPGSWTGRSSQVSIFSAPHPWMLFAENLWKSALMFNVHGDDLWRHNISGSPQLFLPVGLLFVAGTILAVRRRMFMPGLLALLWLVLGIAPAALSSEGVPHALRALLAAPAACLLAGLGAEEAWNWLVRKASPMTAKVASAGFALLLAGHCWTAYFGTFAQAPKMRELFDTEWVELGNEVRALPPAAPKYLIVRGARLDSRGVPEHLYPLAVAAGAHSEKARRERNIRFVITGEEAERAAKEPGAYAFVIR